MGPEGPRRSLWVPLREPPPASWLSGPSTEARRADPAKRTGLWGLGLRPDSELQGPPTRGGWGSGVECDGFVNNCFLFSRLRNRNRPVYSHNLSHSSGAARSHRLSSWDAPKCRDGARGPGGLEHTFTAKLSNQTHFDCGFLLCPATQLYWNTGYALKPSGGANGAT